MCVVCFFSCMIMIVKIFVPQWEVYSPVHGRWSHGKFAWTELTGNKAPRNLSLRFILTSSLLIYYRYRNSRPKSKSGLLLPWGFYGLSFGVHGNARCCLLPPWMADAVDSHGCLWSAVHPYMVVRLFIYCISAWPLTQWPSYCFVVSYL